MTARPPGLTTAGPGETVLLLAPAAVPEPLRAALTLAASGHACVLAIAGPGVDVPGAEACLTARATPDVDLAVHAVLLALRGRRRAAGDADADAEDALTGA
ncbi:MAG: hypothetical protein U0Q15_12370 [Kineosporiaceae bacterium]